MNWLDEENYLTNIPQDVENFGFCKVLHTRYETIHLKHILTEIFVKRNIDIQYKLNMIGWDIFQYMEFITNRIRQIYKISRQYRQDINSIVKRTSNFFPLLDLYKGLNNVIILDFDGVITKNQFSDLYKLCIERNYTVVCSANPTITEDWFFRRNLPVPHKIYSRKGKQAKLKQLVELAKKYDNCLYVDNEEEYLNFAALFGINTFIYKDNKIKNYSIL